MYGTCMCCESVDFVLFFYFFFFFKQKTAYEMSISDWSSDVCSSDLYVRLKLHETPVFADAMARQERVKVPLVELFSQYWAPTLLGAEIGRASCRERVCQYV